MELLLNITKIRKIGVPPFLYKKDWRGKPEKNVSKYFEFS